MEFIGFINHLRRKHLRSGEEDEYYDAQKPLLKILRQVYCALTREILCFDTRNTVL
jgi:hypothetical protein